MKLDPFVRVDDVPFSTRPQDLEAHRGRPLLRQRNDVGLHELDYGDSVFRFEDSGRLEEVTQQATVLQLPQAAVPLPFLKAFIVGHDPAAFERAGFIVSPKFGLAFAPESPKWVTALAKHCIDAWRALGS
jgi:hypothetical protein